MFSLFVSLGSSKQHSSGLGKCCPLFPVKSSPFKPCPLPHGGGARSLTPVSVSDSGTVASRTNATTPKNRPGSRLTGRWIKLFNDFCAKAFPFAKISHPDTAPVPVVVRVACPQQSPPRFPPVFPLWPLAGIVGRAVKRTETNVTSVTSSLLAVFGLAYLETRNFQT